MVLALNLDVPFFNVLELRIQYSRIVCCSYKPTLLISEFSILELFVIRINSPPRVHPFHEPATCHTHGQSFATGEACIMWARVDVGFVKRDVRNSSTSQGC